MTTAVTKVEILFTAKDGSGAGLKAVEQAVSKSAAAAGAAAEASSTKSAAAAAAAASKSKAALDSQYDHHVRVYRELSSAREHLGVRAERQVQDEIRKTQDAYQSLARSGTLSSRELGRMQDATLAKVRALKNELGEIRKLETAGQLGAAAAAGGLAAKRVVDNPVAAYADLESAQDDLKIALMKKGGTVSASAYEGIMRQAVDLGNKLPGSTKDFVAAATALSEQGMPESAIIGGGLAASANFGVLAKMDQYQSATTIAKMREAYGLGDAELPDMANLMQKARYAYGIAPDDFRAVAQYAAPTYNTLGLRGKDTARDLLAVQGMAASVGLENTSFGTNFAMMLQRTSQVDARAGGRGKEAEEVRQVLKEFGIKLNFYTAEGKFAGIEHMFSELEKLKPLTDLDRMHVLNKLFGVEAGRPASIIIDKGGLAAFRESRDKLDAQSDMGARIAMKTSSLKSKEEALAGTWENTRAAAGKGLGESKKGALDWMNSLLGDSIQPVLDKHPGLGTGAITLGAGGAFAASAYATTRVLQSVMGSGAGLRLLSALPSMGGAGALSRLAVIPKGAGLFGLGAGLGGALLSSVAGEDSATARYGSAALSGAGLGATVGSIVPGVGTVVGAGVGGALGMALQGLTDLLKQEPKPTNVKADITVGLAPGLVLTGQNMQASGPAGVQVNTGNIWTGAPR